jgi:uncharacterized nucleotidyltransferase DUF6036
MQPDSAASKEYVEAFREIVFRIARALSGAARRSQPVRMYVAGGAAMHLYTGERVSEDIDAVFSRRIALPEDLEVAYRDADGAARLLYFDRQYNDTLGLLHEQAHEDAVALSLEGIDPRVMEVRLLSPLDLAVSKVGRLSQVDRDDIALLVRRGLVDPAALRKRSEEAMADYIGDLTRLRNSIEIAFRIADDSARRRPTPRRSRPK